MNNKYWASQIVYELNKHGAGLGGASIGIIESVLEKNSCTGCNFQSNHAEFEICDNCKRNTIWRDFFEPKEVTR